MALYLAFALVLGGGVQAGFDISRVPTVQDLEAMRAMGWDRAAAVLEPELAEAWRPAHFAQAGSTGNTLFRHWQLLHQWMHLLGTPEPEAVRAFLGRRIFEDPEQGNALLVTPPGLPRPVDATGRSLPSAADRIDPARVPPEILQALLPDDYTTQNGPVALRANPDFLMRLAGDGEFLREFFRQLSPDDFPPVALTRLEQLYNAFPNKWPEYRSLMLAFALVFDQREPAFWPHRQVPRNAVVGMDETMIERFGYYVQMNDAGRLDFDLRRLSAAELKFVVDAFVPRSELEWAARNVKTRRNQFEKVFSSVRYDRHRAERGIFDWQEGRYLLPNIELAGGICTDQAHFASIAGKARGIPTLYFAGQGTDGGHAWFGFLRNYDRWELDAGRYVNQNYTVGEALDPQTWLPISDHELLYLSGRTARQPKLDAALGDLAMAAIFARRGDEEKRVAAVDSALHNAPELVAAWEAKEEALEEAGDHEGLRAHYARAIEHFRRENDLRVRFQARLAELESAGGDEKIARRLRERMIRDNRRQRADLSATAGADSLERLVAEGDFERAMREYRSLTRQIGRQGGGNYFFDVVRPFVRQLRDAGRMRDADRALQLARREMGFAPNSILDREFRKLEGADQ